jgi:hypothetical protein
MSVVVIWKSKMKPNLWRVLRNITQSRRRNSFKRQFWFLDAENEERDGAGIHASLGKIFSSFCELRSTSTDNAMFHTATVTSNVSNGPCGSFLDTGIEFLQTSHKSI